MTHARLNRHTIKLGLLVRIKTPRDWAMPSPSRNENSWTICLHDIKSCLSDGKLPPPLPSRTPQNIILGSQFILRYAYLEVFKLERSFLRHCKGGFTTSFRHSEVAMHMLHVFIY